MSATTRDGDRRGAPVGERAGTVPPAPDGTAWDLLVIGGGAAGLTAAKTAAGFGASVLLVERDRTGGDCLWTGCVPSKALLAAAHAAADARAAARFGVHIEGLRVDFAQVMRHVRGAITAIEPVDSPATLESAGVRVGHGTARFTGADTAVVGASPRLRFRQALIATGSTPTLPPIPGLAGVPVLTSDTVWDLNELPARMLVLGGGSIGCELGQAFARLGSAVSIVEAGPTLLPREDPIAAALLGAALTADGVRVRTGVRVVAVDSRGAVSRAVLDDGTSIAFDRALVAVGRRPITLGLGLADAGVDVDEGGFVRVDERLRTTNPRIWAAGDVSGHPQFTHTAGVHGAMAAANAVLGLRRTVDAAAVPRVTFTRPEVAAVGLVGPPTGSPGDLSVRTVRHDEVDRAIADNDVLGVTRIVLDRRGRIVGATIVGPRAGESLAELVLAVRGGLRARDVAATMHAYPTYADGAWKAAIAEIQDGLARPRVRFVTGALCRARRRWMSRSSSGPAPSAGPDEGLE